jgi:hypothetical protein
MERPETLLVLPIIDLGLQSCMLPKTKDLIQAHISLGQRLQRDYRYLQKQKHTNVVTPFIPTTSAR